MRKKLEFFCLFLAFFLLGCDEDSATDEIITRGSVQVYLANSSSLSLTASAAPSSFSVRLKMIYLQEDIEGATEETGFNGNNLGQGIRVWVDPDCVESSTNSETGEEYSDIKSDTECTPSYLDLNRASEDVNTDLNSQKAAVLSGTYNYIRLALHGEQQGGSNSFDNVRWNAEGTDEQEFAALEVETTAKFAEPLIIAEGDSINVSLTYDLSEIVEVGLSGQGEEKEQGEGIFQPGRYDDCDDAANVCINMPRFTVSAERE